MKKDKSNRFKVFKYVSFRAICGGTNSTYIRLSKGNAEITKLDLERLAEGVKKARIELDSIKSLLDGMQ